MISLPFSSSVEFSSQWRVGGVLCLSFSRPNVIPSVAEEGDFDNVTNLVSAAAAAHTAQVEFDGDDES